MSNFWLLVVLHVRSFFLTCISYIFHLFKPWFPVHWSKSNGKSILPAALGLTLWIRFQFLLPLKVELLKIRECFKIKINTIFSWGWGCAFLYQRGDQSEKTPDSCSTLWLYCCIYNMSRNHKDQYQLQCTTATSTPLFVPRSSTAIAIRGHGMEVVTIPSTARLEKGKGGGDRLTDSLEVSLEAYRLLGTESVPAKRNLMSLLYDNSWQC